MATATAVRRRAVGGQVASLVLMEDRDPFAVALELARQGDHDAISTIWRVEQPRLLRVLRAEVGDAADDVASQTWLEVMGALRRFEGDERGFRSLLFTIARRRVADHRRTQRRKPATPTAPVDLHDLRATIDARSGHGSDVLARIGSEEAVAAIVGLLNPDQAEILLLRVVAGFSVGEVAAVVGRNEGAIRVQQHRAMRRLAELLGEDGPDDL
jgi:RNA polymerase sigma-70 factor (ECF subfamily)